MCMHAHKVFISNKSYKKACNVFKNGRKNLFSLQNLTNEKIV